VRSTPVGEKGVVVAIDDLYNKLRELARSCSTEYYSEVVRDIGGNPKFPLALVPMLKAVDRAEHAACRPLLAAVVINKEHEMPGKGFFDQARELGLHTGGDDRASWLKELARVCDHWSRH
jgi:hypothetical protein